MNTDEINEQAPIIEQAEDECGSIKPVGNTVCVVEVSNLIIGSMSELIEDVNDSQIALLRMNEETEPLESVFSDLRIP